MFRKASPPFRSTIKGEQRRTLASCTSESALQDDARKNIIAWRKNRSEGGKPVIASTGESTATKDGIGSPRDERETPDLRKTFFAERK